MALWRRPSEVMLALSARLRVGSAPDAVKHYEICCRDLCRLNGLEVPLERALLTHDILVSIPPFGF